MDKKTFLEELRKSLRVLKDEELQDIIGEYEQHIDLKVKNGLTEEQAIADFGHVKALSAEILEAYHVRAEFDFSEENVYVSKSEGEYVESVSDTEAKATEQKGVKSEYEGTDARKESFFKNGFKKFFFGCQKVISWFRLLLHKIWIVIGWCGAQFLRPFHWLKERRRITINKNNTQEKTPDHSDVQSERNDEAYAVCRKEHSESTVQEDFNRIENENHTVVYKRNWGKRTLRGLKNMLHSVWNRMMNALIFCVRISWNCCTIGTAFLIGGLGLICLYIAGVLAVLWFQGYPLAGLTIGCIGLVLSLFAGAALVWTLIWRKTKTESTISMDTNTMTTDSEEMEGVHHA